MANEIEICNLALTRVGANTIAAFTDPTQEATICNSLYAFARDNVFRDHDWAFASKPLALTLLTETHPEWDYVYAYPGDCMAARRIANPYSREARNQIPYIVGFSSTGNFQTVLTNQPQATLIYTAKVLNSAAYDAVFCDAVAWRLAAEMVQPLRAEAQLSLQFSNRYLQVLSSARALTSNEQKAPESTGGDFTDARGYSGSCRDGDCGALTRFPNIPGVLLGP